MADVRSPLNTTLLAAQRREYGTALVFVTHALPLAQRYATHVAWVHDGGVTVGPAAQLLAPDSPARLGGGELP